MTRVISLFLPTWATDRVRRKAENATLPPEAPLVLVGRQGRRWVVLAADAAARAAGLRDGMLATQAQVLVPGLALQAANPTADAAALDRLAMWVLQRYAPIVAADHPDGIVIDSTGADHLYNGETAMLSELINRLTGSGISARAAIADTWGAAHALARYAACPALISPPKGVALDVAPLPLMGLRLPEDIVSGLRALGFERIGDLLGQLSTPLALRFGPQLGRRLDQALGRTSDPITAIRSPELIEVRRTFPEPISAAETITLYIGKLIFQLCEALENKGLGARRLDLICHRIDRCTQPVRVNTALPVRDVKRLTRLLCDKIEMIEPGFGIEIMTLSATLTGPLLEKQMRTKLVGEPEADVSDLIDTLANRVGERRIYRIGSIASDVPERSVCRIRPMAPETKAVWPSNWPRPTRLLPLPEPIHTMALLPDHPPVWFIWRGIRRHVRRADGPERVFGEWWSRNTELVAVRDYFQVEDDAGARYWVFRSGDGVDAATGSHCWYLHGLFG